MRLPFLEYAINESTDFVTRIDRKQASSMFALRTRGMVNRKKGMVSERDFGTQHMYAVYPIRPNAFKTISATASASGLIRVTATGHGFSTDDIISIDEVGGTVEAIGTWKIIKFDNDKFDLVGSTFVNAWTSGGICSKTPISITECLTLYDQTTDTEYDVIVGTDSNTKTRFYIRSGSSWIELTQKINALINGAPVQPANVTTNQVVTIDTPTDEGGAVFTLGTDTLNGFVVYHTATGTASFVLDSTATTITIPHDVTIVPYSWANDNALVFFRCTGIYDGFNYSNGSLPHIRSLQNGAKKKLTILYADNSSSSLVRKSPLSLIYQSASRGLFPAVTTATAATGSITTNGGQTDGDEIVINGWILTYKASGANGYDQFDEGVTNDLINVINRNSYLSAYVTASGQATGSMNVALVAVTPGVAGNSIGLEADIGGHFSVSAATLLGGVDAGTTGRLNLAVGHYLEKAFFTTAFGNIGTIDSPKTGTSPDFSATLGDGIFVSAAFAEAANTLSYTHLRMYVTALYRGYEESDPICQIVVDGSTSANFPKPTVSVKIDPSLVNKDITGFRLYLAAQTNAVAAQTDWANNDDEYLLAEEKSVLTDNWSYNNNNPYCYSVVFTQIVESRYDELSASAANSILGNLNHALNTERTALKPLYITAIDRTQGAATVVDQDERTLRVSSYDGDDVHEDDNYAEIPADNDGRIQTIPLNGHGDIIALVQKGGFIHIHRTQEIELYDLFKNEPGMIYEQNISGKAVFSCAQGVLFAGPGGIKLLPIGGGAVTTLNPLWDNFYDGSLLIDDASASYITAAYRGAIVGGYYSTLEEGWFACQVNIDSADGGGSEYLVFRFSWKERGKWTVRKFHLGSTVAPNLTVATNQMKPLALRERADGTMMIVTSRGLFKYPYAPATLRYQDGVYSDGRTSDRGIPLDITINIGGLANAIPHSNIVGAKIQHKGSSFDGMGRATLRYYRNNDLATYETKTFPVDKPPIFRDFERAGPAESMQIRMSLPDDDLDNFKDLDVSQIVIGYRKNEVPQDAGR